MKKFHIRVIKKVKKKTCDLFLCIKNINLSVLVEQKKKIKKI